MTNNKLYFKDGMVNFQTVLKKNIEEHIIKNNINIDLIYKNENSLEYLENNVLLINYKHLAMNSDAIDLIQKNIGYIHVSDLCQNINAMGIIKKHLETLLINKFNVYLYPWSQLCKNPSAIDIIEKYLINSKNSKIFISYYFKELCENINAIHIIEKHLDILTITYIGNSDKIENIKILQSLCKNKNAIHIIEKHLRHCNNKHPLSITNLDNISINNLIHNINSWHIIKCNLHNLNKDEYWLTLFNSIHFNKVIKIYMNNNLYNDIIDENKIVTINKSIDELFLLKILQKSNELKFITSNLLKFRKKDYTNLFINPHACNIVKNYMRITKKITIIELKYMCINLNMTHIIELNLNMLSNLDFKLFISNPNIFTYNYNKIKYFKNDINMAIIKEMYRPERIAKFLQTNNNIDLYLN